LIKHKVVNIEYMKAYNHKMKVYFTQGELRINDNDTGYWDADLANVKEFELKDGDVKTFIIYTKSGEKFKGKANVRYNESSGEIFLTEYKG
jgi:hypothetical protein